MTEFCFRSGSPNTAGRQCHQKNRSQTRSDSSREHASEDATSNELPHAEIQPKICSKPIFVRFSRRAGIAASGIVGRVAGLRLRQSDGSWAHRASNQTGLTIRPCTPKRVRGVQSRWESFVPAVDCTRLRCRGLFSSRAREQPFEALTPLEGLQAARNAADVLPRITFAPCAMPCGLASAAWPQQRGAVPAAQSPSISLAQKWNLAKYSRLRFSSITTPPKI